jgi:hypothetical protein
MPARRDANAAQAKLNTIAGALAELMESRSAGQPRQARRGPAERGEGWLTRH